jgi:hypothetical protein
LWLKTSGEQRLQRHRPSLANTRSSTRLAVIARQKVRLYSCPDNGLTKRFPLFVEALLSGKIPLNPG